MSSFTIPWRRHRLIAFLLLTALLTSGARPGAAAPRADAVRVACVGDSITEGTANADHARNSWPRILGRLLAAHRAEPYGVGNFGRSGATMLREGRKPYDEQDVCEAGLSFAPDVVIINLGTNDAVEANWGPHGADFERDARALIDRYRALESGPRIWLSTLTPMYPPHPRVDECRPHRAEIERIIAKLATGRRLPVIDLTTPLEGRRTLLPDGVHPNTAGNELIAMAVYEAVTGEAAPTDPSIRPVAVAGEPHPLVTAGEAVDVHLGGWSRAKAWLEGRGAKNILRAGAAIEVGDFHIRARLRMLGQENSAAAFFLDGNVFGFEGARGTVFRNGPRMGGLRLLHPSPTLWERDTWIDFDVIRNGETVWFMVNGFVVDMALIPDRIERFGFDPTRSTMQVAAWSVVGGVIDTPPAHMVARTTRTPWVDLSRQETKRTVVTLVPRGGLGKPAVIRAPDGERLLRFIPQPAGKPSLAMTSDDEGETWSSFPLPASLTGDGYAARHLPDGRLIVTFRDTHRSSPTFGDLVAWVGSFDDVINQREGQLTARLLDHAGNPEEGGADLEILPDGSIVATSRWHRTPNEPPLVFSVRFTLADLETLVPTRGYDIPLIDLDADEGRHVVVDREAGQYLGHVTTCLLDDGRTILAVYPKGHGRGAIVYKRSTDGGRTWSERLPTPESWASSKEVPTIHRVVDPKTGQKRLILWSGLYPARLAVSADDGGSWSELEPVGDWGGIVVMGFVERLADGSYLAMFHDDGRFFTDGGRREEPTVMTLYKTFSRDGGSTWSTPEAVWLDSAVHLCEPGCIRSPDGGTLAVLLRENSRTRNSYVIFSDDEGRTWSPPRELPASLTGDRHTGKYAPDGRLFISFRDTTHDSPTQGDWAGWVGTWEDLLHGREGQYRVRLKDNKHRWDTTYPGVEVLPDGTFVVTTYGHWDEGEPPYILSARFTLDELDEKARLLPAATDLFVPGMRGVHTYRIPALVTTNAGTLIAARDARRTSGRDLPNDIETVIQRSTDGGASRPVARELSAGPAAYSCMPLLPGGGIGLLDERGDGGAYEGVTFTRIPLSWLLAR